MIRNTLQRFMYGRYGNDQLNMALLALSVTCYVLYLFTGFDPLYWISFLSIFFALFRTLSRICKLTSFAQLLPLTKREGQRSRCTRYLGLG